MTDNLDRATRAQRRAAARARIRRITAGLDDEADVLAAGSLVPRRTRLAPTEHWRPALEPAPEETPAEAHTAAPAEPAPAMPAAATQAPVEAATVEPSQPRQKRRLPLPKDRTQTASWLDRLLVAIEVVAMVGLVAAALVSFGLVDRLQADLARLGGPRSTATATAPLPVATALPLLTPAAATATPAPSATLRPSDAELPGGRISPTPGATPAPTPVSLKGARIAIPAIGVDAPIVEGDDWQALKNGVGHHVGSALPGAADNMVLSAHNDIYGSIFKDLSELQQGDDVLIRTPAQTYHYRVVDTRIVTPKETSVMDPTGKAMLTLITCYPPLVDSHRIVVTAELIG
ncbi:MAG TPA: sortase [Anaerolineae bacterium]|nr:sortase [Anaerolineae bacterium]